MASHLDRSCRRGASFGASSIERRALEVAAANTQGVGKVRNFLQPALLTFDFRGLGGAYMSLNIVLQVSYITVAQLGCRDLYPGRCSGCYPTPCSVCDDLREATNEGLVSQFREENRSLY
jgi:hypothetical protein